MNELRDRKSERIERFLLEIFNIEWSDTFGYIKDIETEEVTLNERGILCSQNYIKSLEKLYYQIKRMSLSVGYDRRIEYYDIGLVDKIIKLVLQIERECKNEKIGI